MCGGVSACFTVVTNQPIDTVRTRLITQGEPKTYNGVFDAIKKIFLNEGIRGFYKGTVPGVLLVAPESAFRFGIYEVLNVYWEKLEKYIYFQNKEKIENDIGMLQSSVNGSLAGISSKTIVYPFDLAKKRLQIQGFDEARKNFGKVYLCLFSF